MNIKQILLQKSEDDFRKFSSALIPNINNVLGVRLPILRKISKEIYNEGYWQTFLEQTDFEYMEEIMLQGMVIGLVKKDPEEILGYIKNFVPKIDNWAVCDSFCTGLKFVNKNQDLVWNFLQPYFQSEKEYDIRFGFVMLLGYFINEVYIDRVLLIIDKFKDDRYYAKMAVAWALSICYIKFPKKTLDYLKKSNLDCWTYNKSIQKICESLRVDKKTKDMLKCLRK